MYGRTLLITGALVLLVAGASAAQTETTSQDNAPQQQNTDSYTPPTSQDASSSSSSSVNNDAACTTACNDVNGMDQMARTVPPVVQPVVNWVAGQARDVVNNACSDSCPKPPTSGGR